MIPESNELDPRIDVALDSYPVVPGEDVLVDVHHLAGDKVYFEIGQDHASVDLTGDKAVAADGLILDCLVLETSRIPLGPPHYYDLSLKYMGANSISLTAYNQYWANVLGTYSLGVNSTTVFTVNGSHLSEGHLGENLVLEYAPIE